MAGLGGPEMDEVASDSQTCDQTCFELNQRMWNSSAAPFDCPRRKVLSITLCIIMSLHLAPARFSEGRCRQARSEGEWRRKKGSCDLRPFPARALQFLKILKYRYPLPKDASQALHCKPFACSTLCRVIRIRCALNPGACHQGGPRRPAAQLRAGGLDLRIVAE